MPRVYIKGVKIPIQEVTWECLCDPTTLVTDEDPHLSFTEDVHEARDQAIEQLKKTFRPPRSLWSRFLDYLFNTKRTHEVE